MWSKKTIEWIEQGVAFVSVPFTWNLPQAFSRCAFLGSQGYKVRAGGPAVALMPSYLEDVAEIGGDVEALHRHNPWACRTSYGCPRKCRFCAVPIIEGDLVELDTWEPLPIICDNNLLGCSRRHFDKVIDSVKGLPNVDFNQGLDARFLTDYHASRLAELDCMVRLAWDHVGLEPQVMTAIERLRCAKIPKHRIRVYVLIGFDDTPDDARYRLETLEAMGLMPNPMRFNPLDALQRDQYVGPAWTDRELSRYLRYWSNKRWFGSIPFDEFNG